MSWDRWIRTVEVEPSVYAADFSRLGEQIEILLNAEARIFHFEAVDDPPAVAAKAREYGFQVGLAFNPETAVEEVVPAADGFDLVLCMSINPGYSGQKFMPEAIGRVRTLRKLLPDDVYVQVDGGVGPDNVRELYLSGASLLVAGTSIFGREDLPRSYRRLVQALA